MRRSSINLLFDLVLVVAGVLTFAGGLVLLTCFHVGPEMVRTDAVGLSRLAWLNLHRLSAFGVLAGTAAHVVMHWRPIVSAFRRRIVGSRRKGPGVDRVLYLVLPGCVVAGFLAWFALPSSAPLTGPAIGVMTHTRHVAIDIHNILGLIALPLAVHHLAHRWGWITRTLRSTLWKGRGPAIQARQASSRG